MAEKMKLAEFISRDVNEGKYFFINLQPDPKKELSVVCGGRELCGEDYSISRDSFDFNSIEFVFQGHGEVEINGEIHELTAGSVFCYGPGVKHRIRVKDGQTLVKYFVDFTGKLSLKLLSETPLGKNPLLLVTRPLIIQQIFENLLKTGQDNRPSSERICELLFEMLILHIGEAGMPLCDYNSMSFNTYEKCRKYIEAHFLDIKNSSEVSNSCNISEAHMSRIFKRYHSCNPSRYIAHLKMSHAASMLLEPDVLIKEVAMSLGYEDQYHFSKVFKRIFSVSPQKFRKQRQK